ncbi:MAG TPA: hypothetical protein EYP23_06365, partial [Thermoplasmata archaeon]|nr:hypothetical protein [Thermoplasmata archaeon]
MREIEKAIDELFLDKRKDVSVDEASRVGPVDDEVVDKPSLGEESGEHKPCLKQEPLVKGFLTSVEKKRFITPEVFRLPEKITLGKIGKTRVSKVPGLVSLQRKKFFEDEKRFFQEKLFDIKKSTVDLFFGKKEFGSRFKIPFNLSFKHSMSLNLGVGVEKTDKISPVFKLPKLSGFRREKTLREEKEAVLRKPGVFLPFGKRKNGVKVSKALSHLLFKQFKGFSSEMKGVEETEASEDLPMYPLVDLSMKDLLKKHFTLEDFEEKKPDTPSATEDVYEVSDSREEFIEHTFFDEDDPFFFANASILPVEGEVTVPSRKMDLGEVELPREALRFEPSVEFKSPTQLEEINVPVVTDKFEEIDFYPV